MTEREAAKIAIARWDMAVYTHRACQAEKTEASHYAYAVRRAEAQSAFYPAGLNGGFQGPFLVGYGD